MLAPLYDFEVRHSKGHNQQKQPDRDQRTRFARQLLANAPRIPPSRLRGIGSPKTKAWASRQVFDQTLVALYYEAWQRPTQL